MLAKQRAERTKVEKIREDGNVPFRVLKGSCDLVTQMVL